MGVDKIKKYIIDESSVLKFSSWGDYYDFPCAGEETIQAYLKDVSKHRKQVEDFVLSLDETKLSEIYEKHRGIRDLDRADNVLKDLGYVYKEENVNRE